MPVARMTNKRKMRGQEGTKTTTKESVKEQKVGTLEDLWLAPKYPPKTLFEPERAPRI